MDMYHRISLYIVCLVLVCLTGCNSNIPASKPAYATNMQTCYAEYYGQAYDSVNYNVLALDLYSEGITLDSNAHAFGTGTNLYISDIFLGDSVLQAGTYRCSDKAQEYTFLPGQDFEGTPTGVYLQSMANNAADAIQVIDSGQFVVRQTTDSLYDIQFVLYYDTHTYEAHFEGPINYSDKR